MGRHAKICPGINNSIKKKKIRSEKKYGSHETQSSVLMRERWLAKRSKDGGLEFHHGA